jgi:hypothetical protein
LLGYLLIIQGIGHFNHILTPFPTQFGGFTRQSNILKLIANGVDQIIYLIHLVHYPTIKYGPATVSFAFIVYLLFAQRFGQLGVEDCIAVLVYINHLFALRRQKARRRERIGRLNESVVRVDIYLWRNRIF